jgi:hypothetical protein
MYNVPYILLIDLAVQRAVRTKKMDVMPVAPKVTVFCK